MLCRPAAAPTATPSPPPPPRGAGTSRAASAGGPRACVNQSVSRVTGSSLRQQGEDRLERLLHHPPLLDRLDAHHVGVARQRPGPGAEDQPAAGQVVEQVEPVGHQPGVVVGQRHDAGAELDVLRPLGRGGDEDLGAPDELVAARVVLTEPHLVVAQPVELDGALEVVLERQRRALPDGVERGEEGPEAQRPAAGSGRHVSSPSPRDRIDEPDEGGVDLVGRLLLHPVPGTGHDHVAPVVGRPSRPSSTAASSAAPGRRRRRRTATAPRPSAPARCSVSSQLRSRLRYQLIPPVKPVRSNSRDVGVELVLASASRAGRRARACGRRTRGRRWRRTTGRGRSRPRWARRRACDAWSWRGRGRGRRRPRRAPGSRAM